MCMAVVLITKMQYGCQIIGDLHYRFRGCEDLIYANQFFDRNNGTTPPCWSEPGNGVKLGWLVS